jgi:hypothetical protein
MKIHITDEHGNIVNTLEVPHSAIIETSPGNTFEVDGSADAGDDPQLVVWAGRRPWVAASKEVMFREQWKAFSIEPQAANVINLRLK